MSVTKNPSTFTKPKTFDEAYALPIGDLVKLKDDMDVMSIRVAGGWTIGHVLARKKRVFTKNHPVLKLATNSGWTVAHEQVSVGFTFDPKDSELKFTNSSGISVAHIQASMGYKFSPRSSLCKLVSNKGTTVRDVMNQYDIDHKPVIVENEKQTLVVTKRI